MMIEQPAFGRRLRRLRVQRGLSQSELAGDDVSASYVSRVESGGRSPNDLIASLFARRLEVPLETLTGPDSQESEDEHRSQRLDVASQLLTAGALRKDGELAEAAELLRRIVAAGAGHSEEDLLWEAAWVLGEVLRELGHIAEEHTVLTGLAETSLSQETPRLAARVATALSENLRHQGRLGEAVRVAEAAVSDIVTLPPTAHERVKAMLALLNSYADSGELENAARLADTLQEIAENVPSRQLRGQVYWAAGSTRFLCGLPQEAARLHEQAFVCLRPDVNLAAWARLCLTSAALRLEHDPSDDALESAEGLLARARQAIELVGRADDLADLMLAEAQLALRQGRPERVLDLTGRVCDGEAEVPLAKLGQCHLMSAKAHSLAGDTAAAQDSYRQAAEILERAGAYRKSSEAWRQLSELLTPGGPQ
ncbi:helix-turn-helix domain-containing protein [Streptomyces sp. NPDC006365]|uniref:helix-turn-helix domain-containing protein n=1 Tax=Streptomyces sp. NPDC006365 TaxID=3364744 RepID=UPI0036D09CB4